MRIFDLALKDLSQVAREKRALIFLVAMPIFFTVFLGFAFRGSEADGNKDHRIPLAVVNPEPAAKLNQALTARLGSSDTVKSVPMSAADAMNALHKQDVAGVLVIPVGFSEQVRMGNKAQLTLIAESMSIEGQSLYQAVLVPVSQLMSAVEISREAADLLNEKDSSPAFDFAWDKWQANSQAKLVRVELAVAHKTSHWASDNPFNQSSPGTLVQFAIFGLVTSAQILVTERKSRTLQRLMTTAIKPWEIIMGHLLAMFAIVLLQTALLVVFGQLALGVNYAREPLGTLLVALAMDLWAASLGLLVGVFAKDEQQVTLFSLIAMFALSALGGAWFPLEVAGGAFAAVGRLLPSAWAMNGFQNILIRGQGLESIWMSVGILSAYALGFFLLAVWRFKKSDA